MQHTVVRVQQSRPTDKKKFENNFDAIFGKQKNKDKQDKEKKQDDNTKTS